MAVVAVFLHVAHGLEPSVANVADVGLVARVDPLVHLQLRVAGEFFATVRAIERPEARVHLHVPLECAVVAKRCPANGADDVANVEVCLFVRSHIHLPVKGFSTLIAGEGALSLVDHFVDFEDPFLLERCSALLAKKRAETCMALHVNREVAFHHEAGRTDCAAERPLKRVSFAAVDDEQATLPERFPALLTLVRAVIGVNAPVLLQRCRASKRLPAGFTEERSLSRVFATVSSEVGRRAEGRRAVLTLVALLQPAVAQFMNPAV